MARKTLSVKERIDARQQRTVEQLLNDAQEKVVEAVFLLEMAKKLAKEEDVEQIDLAIKSLSEIVE